MKTILLVLAFAISTSIFAGSSTKINKSIRPELPKVSFNDFGRFNGHRQQNSIVLSWTYNATSEVDYFVIEKSYDGIRFYTAGTIGGNGKTNKFVDSDVYPGYSHYRTRQRPSEAPT